MINFLFDRVFLFFDVWIRVEKRLLVGFVCCFVVKLVKYFVNNFIVVLVLFKMLGVIGRNLSIGLRVVVWVLIVWWFFFGMLRIVLMMCSGNGKVKLWMKFMCWFVVLLFISVCVICLVCICICWICLMVKVLFIRSCNWWWVGLLEIKIMWWK